jgi:hypothetical protein
MSSRLWSGFRVWFSGVAEQVTCLALAVFCNCCSRSSSSSDGGSSSSRAMQQCAAVYRALGRLSASALAASAAMLCSREESGGLFQLYWKAAA